MDLNWIYEENEKKFKLFKVPLRLVWAKLLN